MKRLPGFTLLELLVGVIIFSSVLMILFSVFAAMRQTEQFRTDNSAVTQAGSSALAPVLNALQSAATFETVRLPNGVCSTIRGFYATTDGVLPNWSDGSVQTGNRLVVIDTATTFDSERGARTHWRKHEFFLQKNAKGTNQLVEATYAAIDPYLWPADLTTASNDCPSASAHWSTVAESEVAVTSDTVSVERFDLRFLPPLVTLANGASSVTNAPFVTLSLTLRNTTAHQSPALPLTTTFVPTFSYGEQRDR